MVGERELKLSIVIPALNEEGRLPRTLTRLVAYLRSRPYAWEIVVVSNGSTDGTDETVVTTARDVPELRLVSIPERGKGIAVRTGIARSSGEIVLLCDADLSMPPETLAEFLEAADRADVVVGSREAAGAVRYSEPRYRHLMGRVFNRLVNVFAVRGIADTQCGFKAFRRSAALHLAGQAVVNGFGFDVELLFLARKFHYTIEEIGIEWHFDADSRVRPGVDTLNMVSEVFMIRFRDVLGRYHAAPSPAASGGDLG